MGSKRDMFSGKTLGVIVVVAIVIAGGVFFSNSQQSHANRQDEFNHEVLAALKDLKAEILVTKESQADGLRGLKKAQEQLRKNVAGMGDGGVSKTDFNKLRCQPTPLVWYV